VLVYGHYDFAISSVHDFPTIDDLADRSCRYLVLPPTMPSMARDEVNQRPPRGGRGKCRRACERIPLRAAAAVEPPAGAQVNSLLSSLGSVPVERERGRMHFPDKFSSRPGGLARAAG
jgi:hypothetical protein